jgi:hypothetical protein
VCELGPEKLIDGEGLVIEKIEERMEDFGRWARRGWKWISSSPAVFENPHRKNDVP